MNDMFIPPTWERYGGSAEPAISEMEYSLKKSLPEDYKEFLISTNGGEGFVGDGYLMLWKGSDILPFNAEYNAAEQIPDFLIIGSNGGGEAFAYNFKRPSRDIVMVPFIGMDEELAETVASDIRGLFDFIAKSET